MQHVARHDPAHRAQRLGTGRTGRLHEARLDAKSVGLLRALGLSGTEEFRL